MKTTIYKCISSTEATDKANLYYIQVNAAHRMERDAARKIISILNKRNTIIAVFQY